MSKAERFAEKARSYDEKRKAALRDDREKAKEAKIEFCRDLGAEIVERVAAGELVTIRSHQDGLELVRQRRERRRRLRNVQPEAPPDERFPNGYAPNPDRA